MRNSFQADGEQKIDEAKMDEELDEQGCGGETLVTRGCPR